MKYLDNAPAYLRDMHEGGKEGQARKLLGVLLSDHRMDIVWTRLNRQIKTDFEWLRLWLEVKNALFDANPKRKPKRPSEEAEDLKSIAAHASKLAEVIRIERRVSRDYKGFFDFECWKYFPDEVMKLNNIHSWNSLDSFKRRSAVNKIMGVWPTMAELLEGLAAKALDEANKVKSKRTVLRDKDRWAETMFIRKLHEHLATYQWKKNDSIFVTIATLTNMAIKAKYLKTQADEEVSAKFVRNAVT